MKQEETLAAGRPARFAARAYMTTMLEGTRSRIRHSVEIRNEYFRVYDVMDLLGVPLHLGLCVGHSLSKRGQPTMLFCILIRNPQRYERLAQAQRAERQAHESEEQVPQRTPGLIYFDLERRLTVPADPVRQTLSTLMVRVDAPVMPIIYGVARSSVVFEMPLLKEAKRSKR